MPTYYLTDGRCGRCNNVLLRTRSLSGHDKARREDARAETDALLADAATHGWERPSDGGDEFMSRYMANLRARVSLLPFAVRSGAYIDTEDDNRRLRVYCKRCKITYTLT